MARSGERSPQLEHASGLLPGAAHGTRPSTRVPPSDCTQQCARQRGSIMGQCALEVLQRRAVVELVEVDDLVVRVLLHEADHDVRGDEASTASDHDVLRRVVLSVAIGGALLPQPLGRRSLTVGRHELGACHRDVCVEAATHES